MQDKRYIICGNAPTDGIKEVEVFVAEFKSRIEDLMGWVEARLPGRKEANPSGKKLNRRLELFALYYKRTVGQEYKPGSLAAEGGAAKRTESKLDFYEYRDAVQAYMKGTHPSIIRGNSYMHFIAFLSRWIRENQGQKRIVARYG